MISAKIEFFLRPHISRGRDLQVLAEYCAYADAELEAARVSQPHYAPKLRRLLVRHGMNLFHGEPQVGAAGRSTRRAAGARVVVVVVVVGFGQRHAQHLRVLPHAPSRSSKGAKFRHAVDRLLLVGDATAFGPAYARTKGSMRPLKHGEVIPPSSAGKKTAPAFSPPLSFWPSFTSGFNACFFLLATPRWLHPLVALAFAWGGGSLAPSRLCYRGQAVDLGRFPSGVCPLPVSEILGVTAEAMLSAVTLDAQPRATRAGAAYAPSSSSASTAPARASGSATGTAGGGPEGGTAATRVASP